MKKFIVLLVVVALTLISSMAFAELSVGGSVETRSRNFYNAAANPEATAAREARTQTRVRLMVDGKAGDVAKARVQLENDWDNWGRFEVSQANASTPTSEYTTPASTAFFKLREAWVDVALPLGGLHLRGGHQLLQLGQGWFFRSQKYGSDAWVMYTDIGALHLGLVDVKIAEGSNFLADDDDAYVVVATYKLSDTMKVGVDLSDVKFRATGVGVNDNEIINLGANFTGKIGPVDLKAEVDLQSGDNGAVPAVDYSGMQLVAQVSVPLDPVTINVTLGYGSGNDTTTADENEGYVTFLDADPHYTFLYEYSVPTAANYTLTATPVKNTGFHNTMALGAGASFKLSPALSLGADLWLLTANENVSIKGGTASDDLGMEIDVKVNWKLADNVTWNWTLGMMQPGDAYKNAAGTEADDITGIQGILSVKF